MFFLIIKRDRKFYGYISDSYEKITENIQEEDRVNDLFKSEKLFQRDFESRVYQLNEQIRIMRERLMPV